MTKPLPVLSRNDILHLAYNHVENPTEGMDPTKLSSTKVAMMIFVGLLKKLEVPARLSRIGEFIDQLDDESQDRLHTATVNGLHGPIDYDYVVDLVMLITELWNKKHAQD